MKVSEAIEKLKIGDTVWVKTIVTETDKTDVEPLYVCPHDDEYVWLSNDVEISLTEPQVEKVEVPESLDEYLNWCESYKWITENIVKIENVEYFENHSESTGLTQWVKDNYSIFLIAVSTGEYTIRPKRWVVKSKDHIYLESFVSNTIIPVWTTEEPLWMTFTDKSKAEAVATLVEGSVEEV